MTEKIPQSQKQSSEDTNPPPAVEESSDESDSESVDMSQAQGDKDIGYSLTKMKKQMEKKLFFGQETKGERVKVFKMLVASAQHQMKNTVQLGEQLFTVFSVSLGSVTNALMGWIVP